MNSLSGSKVLVTGGAGFIGSALSTRLSAAGALVTVLDNLATGRKENLADAGDARLVVGDIRDGAILERLLPGTDIVYHLACLGVRHSIHSPTENHEVNASGTLGLLKAARQAGVARFVHVSSSEVYGTARTAPMTEDHPAFPMTVYGASKLAGECYARAFHRVYGYPTVVLRPFNAYGPRCHHEGDSGEVIPKFLLRCLAGRPMVVFGDGAQTRDFTFVDDTAAGILAAGLVDEAVGLTLNLGSGSEVSILELSRIVAAAAGRPEASVVHEAERPGDVKRLCADSGAARAILGYLPSVPLADGLRRLGEWYARAGSTPEDLLRGEVVRNWDARETAVI
ncbi:MAG: GDP-mannose 4,6-dehydratase [Elusimicrobia bacterium]|nr:GDP-mannose 4,6-dehydratase [Elusimicrobiota bacterium]